MTDAIRDSLIALGLNKTAHRVAQDLEHEIFETMVGGVTPEERKLAVTTAIYNAIFNGMVEGFGAHGNALTGLVREYEVDRKTISLLVEQGLEDKALIKHLLPYKEELLKLAAQIDDEKDPFAVWETLDLAIRGARDGVMENAKIKQKLADTENRLNELREAFSRLSDLKSQIHVSQEDVFRPVPPVSAYEEDANKLPDTPI